MRERALWESLFLFQGVPQAVETLCLPPAEVYRKGQVIYGREAFRRALGVVLRGRAEAVARQHTGLTTFTRGSVFGAAALFGGGEEYVSCVRAVSECRVQFIPEETLCRLFSDYPQTALNYIAFLSSRVRFLNGKIATYTADSAEGRLYDWCRRSCDASGRLPADVSMTRLAGMLGIGRTSLYRGLAGLEEKHLIKREKGEVIVL